MNAKSVRHIYLPVYYAMFMNGMMALSIGAVLPYLIEERNLSYGLAGTLLSLFAFGNLAASVVSPVVTARIGIRRGLFYTYFMAPVCLILIALAELPAAALGVCFFLLGIVRGMVSVSVNAVINDHCGGRGMALSLLHMVGSIGCFLAPFFSTFLIRQFQSWQAAFLGVAVLSVLCVLCCSQLRPDHDFPVKKGAGQERSYLRSADFYIIGLVLFFYLGVENCINGWFVTYFKESGMMSEAYASALVSITWLAIMVGRLFTALISDKVKPEKWILLNCLLSALCFGVMILICTFPEQIPARLAVLTAAMLAMGFFLSGIFPTGVANVSRVLQGSPGGMALFLAISAAGGIVMPQIVGWLADMVGLHGAIGSVTAGVAGMVGFAVWNWKRGKDSHLKTQ